MSRKKKELMLEMLRQNLTERRKEFTTIDPGANQLSMSKDEDHNLKNDQERASTTPTRGTKDQATDPNTGTSHSLFTGSPSMTVGQPRNPLQEKSARESTQSIKLNQIKGKW